MDITNVRFLKSSAKVVDCPDPVFPEYAFAGRSNSGKSSLINMITDRKKLAAISSIPGKTRLINHFLVNESWYLADLPGYGYARISNKIRKSFPMMIKEYLLRRQNLACLFLLIDSRHDPLKNDLEILEWLGVNRIPFVIVFTKTDKVTSSKIDNNIERYRKKLLDTWEYLPPLFKSSSVNNEGRDKILGFIEETNNVYTSGKSR